MIRVRVEEIKKDGTVKKLGYYNDIRVLEPSYDLVEDEESRQDPQAK